MKKIYLILLCLTCSLICACNKVNQNETLSDKQSKEDDKNVLSCTNQAENTYNTTTLTIIKIEKKSNNLIKSSSISTKCGTYDDSCKKELDTLIEKAKNNNCDKVDNLYSCIFSNDDFLVNMEENSYETNMKEELSLDYDYNNYKKELENQGYLCP